MCESKAVYCIGAAFTIIGCLLLAVFCSEYVPGYSYSRDFNRVTCAVHTSQMTGNVCCEAAVTTIESCGEEYIYPCLRVLANITDSTNQAVFYDEVKSAIYGARLDDMPCSYFHCDSSSYEKRLEDVEAFANDHQPGSSYECYYGQKDDMGRALKNTITSDDLLAAVIISILLILAGVITCVIMAVIDRFKEKKETPLVPPSAENLKQGQYSDDDSDIETIEISTTITTVSAKSGKGSARSNVTSARRNPSFSGHQ